MGRDWDFLTLMFRRDVACGSAEKSAELREQKVVLLLNTGRFLSAAQVEICAPTASLRNQL